VVLAACALSLVFVVQALLAVRIEGSVTLFLASSRWPSGSLKNTGAAGIDLAPVLELVEHGSALDLVDEVD
jgi:hypothetical protein